MGGGHFADTTTLTRQLYEKKVPTKMIALLVAPPEPKFAELGEACIGVIGSSQWEPIAKYSPEAAKAAGVEWFGPTVPEFLKEYKAKYNNEEPSYHSAGGYAAGLILQKAIEKAGSIETDKVKAAIDAEDMFTFYGHIKFDTTPKLHGLQDGHEMIYYPVAEGPAGQTGKGGGLSGGRGHRPGHCLSGSLRAEGRIDRRRGHSLLCPLLTRVKLQSPFRKISYNRISNRPIFRRLFSG